MCQPSLGLLDISDDTGGVRFLDLALALLHADFHSFYQEHLCKNLSEKYTHLSTAMDNIINEANSEIQTLQNKIAGR